MHDRDDRLDLLRGIGFCCIILAHSGTPALISQIRNFGVPLLVLISGIAFAQRAELYGSYGDFVRHRLTRLVFPSWIFLLFFFLSSLLFLNLTNIAYPFSVKKIVSSFFFTGGIDYVWIIRVFVLLALITPPLLRLNKYIQDSWMFYLLLVVIFSVYEVAFHYHRHGFVHKHFLYYLVPYGCVFAMGVRISFKDQKHVLLLALSMGVAFAVYSAVLYYRNGYFVPTQAFKFPPRIYYLSYGSFAALLTYLAVSSPSISKCLPARLLSYVGRSSMWAYLWHIYTVYFLDWTIGRTSLSWYVRAAILFFVPLCCLYVQKALLSRALKQTGDRARVALITVSYR